MTQLHTFNISHANRISDRHIVRSLNVVMEKIEIMRNHLTVEERSKDEDLSWLYTFADRLLCRSHLHHKPIF